MSVLCVYCNKPTSEPTLCALCNEFVCEKCVIRDKVNYCVKCFLGKCSPAERKMWTKVLTEKGVIREDISTVLSFQGRPVLEMSQTRLGDRVQYLFKCRGAAGVDYVKVQKEVFDGLWSRALKLGFRSERIPMGERIKIAKVA